MVSRCGIDMAALRREREARRGAPPPADSPADSSSLGQGGRVLATGAEADPAPSPTNLPLECTSFGSDFQRWAEEKKIEFVLAMLWMFVGLVGIIHFGS